MSKPARAKYRTTNWKAYNAALKARGALTMWLDRDMQWLAAPSGTGMRASGRRETRTEPPAAEAGEAGVGRIPGL